MTIGIVGLGLIGGSLAKALKAYTDAVVWGGDISQDVLNAALDQGAIDGRLTENGLSQCDMVIVALYPAGTVEYVKKHAPLFKKGAIVMDCCGVKSPICSALKGVTENAGFIFVGAHPMAGVERGGFENSFPEMFKNASLILTPYEYTPREAVESIWQLASKLGFGRLQIITPELHDQMISYTSHLCHLVSCAYIGSPLALEHGGFSAGSFRDMTRIAKINEEMWAELFIENREHLCREAEEFIRRLRELTELARRQDRRGLCSLLRKCREVKESLEAMQEESQ